MKHFILILICFLCFRSVSQTFNWAKNVSAFTTQGKKIACDQNNDIINTGTLYGGTVDFDLGPGTFNLTPGVGNNNSYIAKYKSNGDFVWAKLIFSQNYDNHISDFKLDTNNNVYLIGKFKGTIDFDPGIGVFNMTNNNQNNLEQMFIEKLDSSGNFLWAKKIGGTLGYTLNPSCCLTSVGELIIIDAFNGTIDFDPNVGIQNLTANNDNAYILKLDANGQFIWARQFLGGTNSGMKVITALDHNIYLIGTFQNTIDADPNLGVFNITGTSSSNVFIIKLNSNADFIWARHISSYNVWSSIVIFDINCDSLGNIYYCGYYADSADFDPGFGVDMQSSNGAEDCYFSKLDSAGVYQWTRSFGGSGFDQAYQIITDSLGNSYLLGTYTDTVDFNPNINNGYYLYGGQSFISKFDSIGKFTIAYSLGNANAGILIGRSISKDFNENMFITGYFYGTQDFNFGAGVYNLSSPGAGNFMFIEKFGFCGTYHDTSVAHCNTINLWGTNYDSSQQFVQMFSDANECDSNMSVNLTIIYGPTDTMYQTECKTFTINNITYTTPGLHVQSYPIGGVCDSLLVISLTLINPGALNIIQTIDTLQAFPSGYAYQWLDCTTNLPISGAIDSVFVPTSTGSYKAVVFFGAGCSDTTTCKDVIISNGEGVNDFSLINFDIKPNPTKGHFEIINKEYKGSLSVKITDIFGKKIFHEDFNQNDRLHLDLSTFSNGLYILQIDAKKQKLFLKIVKQQ